MTKVILAALVLLVLGCGKFEPASVPDSDSGHNGETTRQVPTPTPQGSLRPPPQDPSSPQNWSGPAPKVTELSLGTNPASPWVFRPRNDLPDWDFSLPLDWSVDAFEDRSWQHHLHSWRTMEFWLHEYRLDGDVTQLRVPIEIALDWHRFHVEEGRTSAFQWYDHSTGLRASRLAFLLDFILSDRLEVSDADLARLMTLADLHAEKLMEPAFLSPGNHGLFQLVGLDALCSVVGWRDACQGARSYAKEAFVKLVKSWFSDEGVHLESSPLYHDWVIRKIRELGAVERFQQPGVQGMLERADAISPWLTYPDGRWVPVGDSHGVGPQLTGPVKPDCLPDGAGCWAVRDFTKSGYALVRSLPEAADGESNMLFVSAMAAGAGHKHSDDLSFVLMEGGREIFTDSGMYGYNYDEVRSYVLSARAHNVPSLVDRRIDPAHIDPANTHLDPVLVDGGQFVIRGTVDRPGLFLHERVFSYVPGALLRVEDRLNNQTSSRWQSNLHLAPDLIPEISERGFAVSAGDLTVRAEFSGDGCDISAVRGETDPYQGWVSIGYLEMTPATVVIATCPSDLVESSWHITFEQ